MSDESLNEESVVLNEDSLQESSLDIFDVNYALFRQVGQTCQVASSITALYMLDAQNGNSDNLKFYIGKYLEYDDSSVLSNALIKVSQVGSHNPIKNFNQNDFLHLVEVIYLRLTRHETLGSRKRVNSVHDASSNQALYSNFFTFRDRFEFTGIENLAHSTSFDNVGKTLSGLSPGDLCIVISPTFSRIAEDGSDITQAHAYIFGRQKISGMWFIHDQANPYYVEGDTIAKLIEKMDEDKLNGLTGLPLNTYGYNFSSSAVYLIDEVKKN